MLYFLVVAKFLAIMLRVRTSNSALIFMVIINNCCYLFFLIFIFWK